MDKRENNFAFVDGQNLYFSTVKDNWCVDFKKLKVYLRDKYKVKLILYFWGYYKKENEMIYQKLKDLNYKLLFKKHNEKLISKKKGNVDSEIIFETMKKLESEGVLDKVVLISGDGDYRKMINYLINKNKFKRILFPTRGCSSSLYKDLGSEWFSGLDEKDIRGKIELLK